MCHVWYWFETADLPPPQTPGMQQTLYCIFYCLQCFVNVFISFFSLQHIWKSIFLHHPSIYWQNKSFGTSSSPVILDIQTSTAHVWDINERILISQWPRHSRLKKISCSKLSLVPKSHNIKELHTCRLEWQLHSLVSGGKKEFKFTILTGCWLHVEIMKILQLYCNKKTVKYFVSALVLLMTSRRCKTRRRLSLWSLWVLHAHCALW